MSTIIKKYRAIPTREGAGVIVNRVFGHNDTKAFDPFLMLDYFEDESNELKAGFPWHPHRGIETITYLIKGHVKHEDSMGNAAQLKDGEVQWMNAGRGVMHQEMPMPTTNGVQGFQFWVNIPAKDKMNQPDYKEIHQGEMVTYDADGVSVKLIAGQYKDKKGAINKDALGIKLFHVSLEKGSSITLQREKGKNGYLFLFEGNGELNNQKIEEITAYTLTDGTFNVTADENMEFIFAEGKPLNESIAWGGPIVMNTQEELQQAFEEIRNGEFV
jgi:redox-sensitive bicupin YhaK (pirin superfamily)